MSSARSRDRALVPQASHAYRPIGTSTRPSADSTGASPRLRYRVGPPHAAHAGAFAAPPSGRRRTTASRPRRADDSTVPRMRRSGSAPPADSRPAAAAYFSIAASNSSFVASNSRLLSMRSSPTVRVVIAGILRSSDYNHPQQWSARGGASTFAGTATTVGWRSLTKHLSYLSYTPRAARDRREPSRVVASVWWLTAHGQTAILVGSLGGNPCPTSLCPPSPISRSRTTASRSSRATAAVAAGRPSSACATTARSVAPATA